MRIMIVISSLRGGGAERASSTLSRVWSDSGHSVHMTTLSLPDSDFYKLDPRVTRGALGLEQLSPTFLHVLINSVRRTIAIRREIRAFTPDVIVGFMPSANILASIAALGMRAKVVGCERTHPPQAPMDRFRSTARAWFYGLLDATVALTAETAEWLRTNTRARRISVIPNVVALPLAATDPFVSPSVWCGAGRSIVLAAGRLAEEKGFDSLIDAFALICANHPTWDLVIVGEGPLREQLRRQIDGLSLGNRVFLPGRVGNVADWYARASLSVMSSRVEGFPNALAEAMAHGLPAVSYDCDTGPRDIIRDGNDGILVPPGDTTRLARALQTLMGDDSLRQRYAERAPDVRVRFSEAKISALWNSLFDGLRECPKRRA